jgi:hypothetical protein
MANKKQGQIRLIEKPAREMYGYVGMNEDAAKAIGFPWPYGKNDIVIDKTIHGRFRRRTEVHELIEKHFMDKGESYWKAHKKAQKAEKYVR